MKQNVVFFDRKTATVIPKTIILPDGMNVDKIIRKAKKLAELDHMFCSAGMIPEKYYEEAGANIQPSDIMVVTI